MKQSTCGAVICQPSGDELKHDRKNSILEFIQMSKIKFFKKWMAHYTL